jgi:TolB-like protein
LALLLLIDVHILVFNDVNVMQKLCLVTIVCLLCCGCAATSWIGDNDSVEDNGTASPQTYLHAHVEKLARQLFSTSQLIDTSSTVAVGTILPSTSNVGDLLPTQAAIGLQIQESLMTFATQAGLKVIEYKTMPYIKIGPQADMMLSRNISELNSNISTDYFLTGTYTLQENNTVVNIRLIQLPENIVLAAATDYVPNDTMWSQGKVTLKNNQIYRNGY